MGTKLALDQLEDVQLPCIIHWNKAHFVVLYKIKKNSYYISDPSKGLISLSKSDFLKSWTTENTPEGVVLLLEPSPYFYEQVEDDDDDNKLSFMFMLRYLKPHKQLIVQLIFGLAAGTLLQLIAPFLTQSVVDIGIGTKNLGFVQMILIAQVMLFLGNISVQYIRSWVVLHLTTRINLSILTDFLIKLMRLPMNFFDSRLPGDIMQRMGDQSRIESFLTGSVLNTLFSLFNFIIFAFVLAYYNTMIFIIYLIATILYTLWIMVFLAPRRKLDYQRFTSSSINQSNLMELIGGIHEIKLNNCEQQKRWGWENVQVKLFNFSIRNLTLNQYQEAGSSLINQSKTILITFLSIKSVIDGDITIGGMMAIQYVLGQLNSPVELLLSFVQKFQDAKISLERLNEIHSTEAEESAGDFVVQDFPDNKTISIKNLTFRYPGAGSNPLLNNISLAIPHGKVTAIVGMSGSGKTTILKLLMRFYEAEVGEINIGDIKLRNISFKAWRSQCGVVMHDGYIFSDSIINNIAVGDDNPDIKRINLATEISNIKSFVDDLPEGLNTKIGSGGQGISQGQKQRLLIARAVYKNPHYLFLDEATNSLDTNNEKEIMDNLNRFFKGKTVFIVAHRLSTVSNADNIIVMNKGQIVESGTHEELSLLGGSYYTLVKNQIDLINN